MDKIKLGDTVVVNYTGRFQDGSVFDTSKTEGREPLTVTLGEGRLIKGFEDNLVGMSIGEAKTIELEPSEAYGDVIESLIIEVPKSSVPETVTIGEMLQANAPWGPISVKVLEINDTTVKIDGNHPMAGL